jgi:tripartite-type tricarboxylate transporter receptor subunit TctC
MVVSLDCTAMFAALSVSSAAAQQQSNIDAVVFPNRAIKIVVPFPAGGPSDVIARMIGQRMS